MEKSQSFVDGLESSRLRRVAEEFTADEQPAALASAAVLRAFKIVSMRVEAELDVWGLTMPRFEILGLLASSDEGHMSLTALSRATILHPATMTYTITSLEKRRFIKRRTKPSDKRVVLAEITPLGRKVLISARQALASIDFGMAEVGRDDCVEIALRLSKMRPEIAELDSQDEPGEAAG